MNYEQRVIEGAKYIYARDSSASADARVDLSELDKIFTSELPLLRRRWNLKLQLGRLYKAISLLSYLKVIVQKRQRNSLRY